MMSDKSNAALVTFITSGIILIALIPLNQVAYNLIASSSATALEKIILYSALAVFDAGDVMTVFFSGINLFSK
jgi:hypothetical protein